MLQVRCTSLHMNSDQCNSSRFVINRANIITMDDANPLGTSMAVNGGMIIGVGSEADFEEYVRDGWDVYDLSGKTVLPGFIDTHCHMDVTGLFSAGVDTRDAASMDDLIQMLNAATEAIPEGEWVAAWYFDEMQILENRVPTRYDLDRAGVRHPIVVTHITTHQAFLNSRALEELGIRKGQPGADVKGGDLTGVIRDPCTGRALIKVLYDVTDDTRAKAFKLAAQLALKAGFTTLHPNQGLNWKNVSSLLVEIQDQIPQNLVIWNASFDLDQVTELGLPRVGGCGTTQIDGAIMSHTAALLEPYDDEPDNLGFLKHTQEELDAFVLEAHSRKLQFCAHAIGDRAIEQVLTSIERALDTIPVPDHRHRIEHCILPTEDQIHRMADARVVAAVQPAFLGPSISGSGMSKAIRFLGEERVMRAYHPYRSMIDAGIRLCGGTDSPVARFDALEGIHLAVNHPNPAQRISVEEAVDMWTRSAAWSGFEEQERGSLEKGKAADMVVLSDDPLSVARDRICEIEVLQTIVGGRVFYRRSQEC
jgi:predicted amidohydrolase YtcJ